MPDVTKDLLIRISAEGGDKPAKELQSIEGQLDSFLTKSLSIGAAWMAFNKAVDMVEAGITAAYNAFAGMIEISSIFEQLGVRFETVFGGAGPAQKALDWATEFAAKTPLSLEQVTERMLKLKTYGFDPMNGTLESIGNAAFALGSDFDGIVTALGQMQLKGKVSAEELMQLAERGVPAIRWVKDEFKLTAEQMEQIGKAGLKVDDVIALIVRKMSEQYAGAMAKASDTWKGSISTISDAWTIFQKKIMDSGPFSFLVENIRMVRDEFSAFVDSETGRHFAANIGGVIESYLQSWWEFLTENVQPAFVRTVAVAQDIFRIVSITWEMLKDWKFVIDIALVSFEAIAATLRTYFEILKGIYDLVKMTFIQPIIDAHNLYVSFIDYVYNGTISAFSKIKTYISDFMLDLLDGKAAGFLDWLGLGSDKMGEAKAYFQGVKDEAIKSKADIDAAYAAKPAAQSPEPYPYAGAPIIYSAELREMSRYNQQPQAQPSTTTAKEILATMQPSGGASQIQLLPPPGDDLMTLIVKYLNQCIKSEGTIGAGF